MRYPDGRESASSIVARTLTAVGVFYSIALGTLSAIVVLLPIASHTLSAVTIFAQIAEVLCRTWEYFRNRSKYYVGRESTPSCSILFFVGHCSTPSRSIENFVGCHVTCANRGGTLSAVKILAHNEEVFLLDVKVYKHRFNEKSSFLVCVFRKSRCKVTHYPWHIRQKMPSDMRI